LKKKKFVNEEMEEGIDKKREKRIKMVRRAKI
jgi:hypothetical protein